MKINTTFKNYVDRSLPKISIPNDNECNHFTLVEYLKNKEHLNKEHSVQWSNLDFWECPKDCVNRNQVGL